MAIKLGNLDISDLKLGSTDVESLRLGITEIGTREEPDPFPYDVVIPMPASQELDFLFSSDIHVAWRNFFRNTKCSIIFSLGADAAHSNDGTSDLPGDFKTYQNKLINAGIPTYLLDCGDGSRVGGGESTAQQEYAIQRMRELGYFGITAGNHEGKGGSESATKQRLDQVKDYGFIACNLFYGGSLYGKPYKTIKVGKKKIGVIGIAYPSANGDGSYSSSTQKWTYGNFTFLDSINNLTQQQNGQASGSALYKEVQKYVDYLKNDNGFDYVIAFMHMDDYNTESWSADSNRGYSKPDFLIKNTRGLDAVIPGHWNNPLYWNEATGKYENQIIYDLDNRPVMLTVEAGAHLSSFGRLRFKFNDGTLQCYLLTQMSDLDVI